MIFLLLVHRWVDNGRVINNFTNQPFSNQMWVVHEERLEDGYSRWYNLTITNPSHDNLGDYMCVAENRWVHSICQIIARVQTSTKFSNFTSIGTCEAVRLLKLQNGDLNSTLLLFLEPIRVVCQCFFSVEA